MPPHVLTFMYPDSVKSKYLAGIVAKTGGRWRSSLMKRRLRSREQSPGEQCDYILSLLRGPALDEVRPCMGGQSVGPDYLFSYLRNALESNAIQHNFCRNFITVNRWMAKIYATTPMPSPRL